MWSLGVYQARHTRTQSHPLMQPTGTASLEDALQAARWAAYRPGGKAVVVVSDSISCLWFDGTCVSLVHPGTHEPLVRLDTVSVGEDLPFDPRGVPLFYAPPTTAYDLECVASAYFADSPPPVVALTEASCSVPIPPPELAAFAVPDLGWTPGSTDPAHIIERLPLSPRTPRTARRSNHGGGRVAGKHGARGTAVNSGRHLDFDRVGASAER